LPLDVFVTAVVETSLNKLISESDSAKTQLSQLKGEVLHIELTDVNKSLYFIFSQQLDVLAKFEGEVNCHLSLRIDALPQLRDHNNLTKLIKQDKLDLQGDIKLAQRFAQLLEECKPDIEEWVSQYMGDSLAHMSVQGGKNLACWFKRKANHHQSHFSQVVLEEWRIAPPALEIAHFCDQVTDAEKEVAQLEQRMSQLLENV
jgi:ubiquinone biosynthesis protein UbiJ